jgi:hypothetical protein
MLITDASYSYDLSTVLEHHSQSRYLEAYVSCADLAPIRHCRGHIYVDDREGVYVESVMDLWPVFWSVVVICITVYYLWIFHS